MIWTLRSRAYLFAARFHAARCLLQLSNYTSTISLSYSFHISKTNCSSFIIDTCRYVCTSMQRAAMRISMMIYILILASLLILNFRELCNIHRPGIFTLHNAIPAPSLYTLSFCYVFVQWNNTEIFLTLSSSRWVQYVFTQIFGHVCVGWQKRITASFQLIKVQIFNVQDIIFIPVQKCNSNKFLADCKTILQRTVSKC